MNFIQYISLLIFSFSFGFQFYVTKGQNVVIDSLVYNHKSVMIEKLFVHTDREFYAQSDTIWYKAYSVDGLSNQPFLLNHNLVVDLVSLNGQLMLSQKLLLKEGYACGDFQIPDSIAPGAYVIRAYTPVIKCLGEQASFHKMIRIEKVMNSFEQLSNYAQEVREESVIDLAVLPEGGNMVYNVTNNIAVKLVAKNGKGIDVSGKVIDETGKTVVEFSTLYQGTGQFRFIPVPGHQYFVRINGYPQINYEFKDIKQDGLMLSVLHPDSGKGILVSIAQNPEQVIRRRLYLTAMSKDEFVFYVDIILDQDVKVVRINESVIPAGISKLTLLNQGFEPLAERLIFRNDPAIQLPVTLNMNKTEFFSRDKAVLSMQTSREGTDSGFCKMSVAVINTAYVDSKGLSQNIISYLLLDSELKGVIESPASYFIDDPTIRSQAKLDLLMLTQGWRKYLWDEYHALMPDYQNMKQIDGIEITGKVRRLMSKKPVPGGQVTMMFFDKGLSILTLKTDSKGIFGSGSLYISDSTHVFIQATNEKDKKNTVILVDSVESEKGIQADYISENIGKLDIPLKFFRYNYYRRFAEREYNLKNGILLEEVKIVGQKPKVENQVKRYSVADETLEIEQKDFYYPDVLSYLQGRVPGVDVGTDYIIIRGGNGNAFIMVDGIPRGSDATAIDYLRSIPMSQIDMIDVLKNISNLAVFGSQGANGVIAVYTRRGEITYRDEFIPGILITKIKGYHQMRQFYSPVYNMENPKNEKPDYRPTLYWNPDLTFNQKTEKKLEFFTSDELSDYLVILEGITGDGRLIYNTTTFLVDKINPDIK